MLLFCLYKKVTKKYTEGGGPLDSRDVRFKALYQHAFLEI